MLEERVKKVFSRIDEMPSFSQIVDRALTIDIRKSNNEELVGEKTFHEPELAKQILEITNFASSSPFAIRDAFFGLQPVLGDEAVRGMMLASSLQEFAGKGLDAYGMVEGDLWKHSVSCGFSSWMIATKIGYKNLEIVFMAGMLHDIGKIILNEILYEEKRKCDDITIQGTINLVELEREICGIDHAEVGKRIAEKWNFEDDVIEAIQYHHQPELARIEPDLTAIVHLADCICVSLDSGLRNKELIHLLSMGFYDHCSEDGVADQLY